MKVLTVFLFSVIFSFTSFCYAQFDQGQDPKKQVRTIDGQVSQSDWVASKLVVDIGGDEITFIVPDDCKVERGTEEISFNDIDQNDSVTIYYYDAGVSGLKAVKITDNSPL